MEETKLCQTLFTCGKSSDAKTSQTSALHYRQHESTSFFHVITAAIYITIVFCSYCISAFSQLLPEGEFPDDAQHTLSCQGMSAAYQQHLCPVQ